MQSPMTAARPWPTCSGPVGLAETYSTPATRPPPLTLRPKAPCARSVGGAVTKSGVARSARRRPGARRASMPCSTRALSVDFAGSGGWNGGRTLYASRRPRPAAPAPCSDPAAGGQRDRRAVAHHEVVEQAHVHQVQGLLQPGGDRAVGGAGLAAAAGVVVAHDDRRRVVAQRAPDHLARVHLGAVDRAAEQ